MEYKRINISDWKKIKDEGSSEVYFHNVDKSLMLILFNDKKITSRIAFNELNYSQHADKCGIPTPIGRDVVIANGKIGIIYQRFNDKVSYTNLFKTNRGNLIQVAEMFTKQLKELHQKKCDIKFFPNIKDVIIHGINENKSLKDEIKHKLIKFVFELGDEETCVHGLPNTESIFISEGKSYWINLIGFSYGNPWYDIGGIYFTYKSLLGRFLLRKYPHINIFRLNNFWKQFVYFYTGDSSEDNYKSFTLKAKKVSILYAIYIMNVEHYSGFKAFVINLLIKNLLRSFK